MRYIQLSCRPHECCGCSDEMEYSQPERAGPNARPPAYLLSDVDVKGGEVSKRMDLHLQYS